jgi:hypothetical protein
VLTRSSSPQISYVRSSLDSRVVEFSEERLPWLFVVCLFDESVCFFMGDTLDGIQRKKLRY